MRRSWVASRDARAHAKDIMPARMIEAPAALCAEIPICIRRDPGNDGAACRTAIW
jgi:fructose-bisphosphate aldolase class II